MTKYNVLICAFMLLFTSGVRAHEKDSMVFQRGVWIIKIHGTREEMAFSLGRMTQPKINESALGYFATRVENSVTNAYTFKQHPLLLKPFLGILDLFIFRPLFRNIPDEDQNVLQAFAQGANIPVEIVMKAYVIPDAGQIFSSALFSKNSTIKNAFGPPLQLGCSTVLAADSRSTDGFLMGRNLDYEGYGIFDRNPTVIFFNPTDPKALKYMTVTSLGLPTAGFTSANEAGIFLSTHQTYIAQTHRRNEPLLSISERVIRNARTLQEAKDILKNANFASSWKVIVGSSRENSGFTAEVSPKNITFYDMQNDILFETNHVRSYPQQLLEYAVGRRAFEDTHLRKKYLQSLFAKKNEKISAGIMADILGSHNRLNLKTKTTEVHSHHGIIAKMDNIQSVVFASALNRVFVAVPRRLKSEYYSKPSSGNFVSIPMEWDVVHLTHSNEDIRPEHTLDRKKLLAQSLYRRGAKLANENSLYLEAGTLFEQAHRLDPQEPLYVYMNGLCRLKWAGLHYKDPQAADQVKLARTLFDEIPLLTQNRYILSLTAFFTGYATHALGDKPAALHEYHQVEDSLSQPLAQWKAKALSKSRAKIEDFKKLVLGFPSGDVFRFL